MNFPPASVGAVYCATGGLFPAGNVEADMLGTAWLDDMLVSVCLL